jgi:phosphoribosyl-ATP pyrophosphohydrolase/phosphoribosyl-AMP cyclohydrolase
MTDARLKNKMIYQFNPDSADFLKMGGLLPAIVQNAHSGQVLMLGYMNQEALDETLRSKNVTFFSRSKNRLWVKGATSGHFLKLQSISLDCDNDALLVQALPLGPTCHKGTTSCFDHSDTELGFLSTLETIIEERIGSNNPDSYTNKLWAKGLKKMAQKVGEEGLETALAGRAGDEDELLDEGADLIFHFLVLLKARDVSLSQVINRLKSRHN